MSEDNVIWIDFRLSKDIRSRQVLSLADRMTGLSRKHGRASIIERTFQAIEQAYARKRLDSNDNS